MKFFRPKQKKHLLLFCLLIKRLLSELSNRRGTLSVYIRAGQRVDNCEHSENDNQQCNELNECERVCMCVSVRATVQLFVLIIICNFYKLIDLCLFFCFCFCFHFVFLFLQNRKLHSCRFASLMTGMGSID